jgi:hypothetical protein
MGPMSFEEWKKQEDLKKQKPSKPNTKNEQEIKLHEKYGIEKYDIEKLYNFYKGKNNEEGKINPNIEEKHFKFIKEIVKHHNTPIYKAAIGLLEGQLVQDVKIIYGDIQDKLNSEHAYTVSEGNIMHFKKTINICVNPVLKNNPIYEKILLDDYMKNIFSKIINERSPVLRLTITNAKLDQEIINKVEKECSNFIEFIEFIIHDLDKIETDKPEKPINYDGENFDQDFTKIEEKKTGGKRKSRRKSRKNRRKTNRRRRSRR